MFQIEKTIAIFSITPFKSPANINCASNFLVDSTEIAPLTAILFYFFSGKSKQNKIAVKGEISVESTKKLAKK